MRTILISGASRGIGRSIAEKAIHDGHKVSLGLRDKNIVKGSILDPNVSGRKNLLVNEYDARNPKDATRWVENTKQQFSEINTLIHCAGIFRRTPLNFSSNEENDIEQLWKVNVLGPWFLTRASWKYLCKSDNSRIIVLV